MNIIFQKVLETRSLPFVQILFILDFPSFFALCWGFTHFYPCICQVESRGFSEEGIYRKSGSEREVKELKERFMKGKDPKMVSSIGSHTVRTTVIRN